MDRIEKNNEMQMHKLTEQINELRHKMDRHHFETQEAIDLIKDQEKEP